MKWEYEKTPLNGGAPGDAFKSIFNGSGKSHAETLAREAIQNSVDAAITPTTSVRVDFRFARIEGDARKRFEKAACMQEMRGRESQLGLFRDNALVQSDGPLALLYIDDFQTTGLKGDPTSPSSNLRKLLMDLGGSGKAHQEEASGGSYGFGKAVYSSTSRIGAIFAFSRTRDGNGRPVSLLMGCAYHEGHEFEGESWTGRAFYGTSTTVPDAGTRYDPFRGDEAETLATRLGFHRDEGDGTSILIVDAGVEPEDVVTGIEDWWWPRIIAGCLEATIVTAEGDEISPRPKKHRHLKPFIDTFYCARGQTPPIPGQLERSEFNRIDGKKVGIMGLVVVDDSEDENPFGEAYEERLDTVAIIRSPLMVVDYHRKWRLNTVGPVVVGCFVADGDIDYELKLSEPPDHSRWDPDADRLLKHSEAARVVVDSVLKRIRTNYKKFQAAAKPPAPPRPKRLERLERALASWFGVGPKGGNPPPDPNPAPISLRPDDIVLEPEEDGRLRARGGVEIKLADKNGPAQRFRVRLELQVAEEEGVSAKDPIPVDVSSEARIERQTDGYWLGHVEGDDIVRIEFISAPYDPEWTIRLLPEVLPFEMAEEVAA